MRKLVGAPIADDIAEEVQRVITEIRSGQLKRAQSDRVVRVITRLTESTIRYFFIVPVRTFGLGMTLGSVAEWGANSAIKVINAGLKRVIPKLRDDQLLQLADFLDESLYDLKRRKK